jgi:hypothetical protein
MILRTLGLEGFDSVCVADLGLTGVLFCFGVVPVFEVAACFGVTA